MLTTTSGKCPGPKPIDPYKEATKQQMRFFYNRLSEKDRRLYAAIEALKLPYGGQSYIINILGCSNKTIINGTEVLNNKDKIVQGRIRKKGGGRKLCLDTIDNIDTIFLEVIEDYTAGDPMAGNIKWTNSGLSKISRKMAEKGVDVSVVIVKQLLKKHNFKKRKAQKTTSIGYSKQRNEQFERIFELKAEYMASDNPVVSIDSKKKELSGNLYRKGTCYTTGIIKVYDHDFPYLADGPVNPFTIFDIKNNSAFVNIGTGKDTSEFVCDSIKYQWLNIG